MKKLLAAFALLMASASANAGVVSAAGGVSWIAAPGTPNFSATVDFTQWWTISNTIGAGDIGGVLETTALDPTVASLAGHATTPELVGVGKFNIGSGIGEPNCNGCQLTFSFGGFFLDISNVAQPVDATDAWLNVYLDYTFSTDFDEGAISLIQDPVEAASQAAKAVDGVLWLSLDVEGFSYIPTNIDPTLESNTAFFGEVTGGIAASNFVENVFQSLYETDAFGLTSGFVDRWGNITNYSIRGSGNVQAQTVSEPGMLALLSIGLVGLVFSARRRITK